MTEKINSKARIKLALQHKEPDRIPIDLGTITVSGIHIKTYSDLAEKLGKKESLKIYDKYQQLAYVSDDIINEFNIDTTPIILNELEDYVEIYRDDIFVDEWGIKRKKPKNGYYYDGVSCPLQDIDLGELKKINFLKILEEINFKDVGRRNENLKNSDKAIVGQIWPGSLFQWAEMLRGFDTFLIDLITNKLYAETLLDKLLEYNITFTDKYLDIFGDIIDVVKIADDMGMQDAPIISPNLYRKAIKGRQKELIDFIKSKTDAKVLFHCDGAVYDLIPDFIDIGIDILQPIQVSASGMDDTRRLKREFGNDLIFWGGSCDSQEILSRANCKKVEEETKKRIEDLAPGGGYIFGPIHNIQPNTPTENIITMFNSAIKYGKY